MTVNFPSPPNGIRVVVKNPQQQCSNPCSEFNGGCSHICAPGKTLPMKTESCRVIMIMIGREG